MTDTAYDNVVNPPVPEQMIDAVQYIVSQMEYPVYNRIMMVSFIVDEYAHDEWGERLFEGCWTPTNSRFYSREIDDALDEIDSTEVSYVHPDTGDVTTVYVDVPVPEGLSNRYVTICLEVLPDLVEATDEELSESIQDSWRYEETEYDDCVEWDG